MSIQVFDEQIIEYCTNNSTNEDRELLQKIERLTQLKTLSPRMLSGELQALFLSLLSKIVAPNFILEIGTFTGYSAIALSQGLTENGQLLTIEFDEEHGALAKANIENSPYSDKITLVVGDAKKLIPNIKNTIDLVFIDADKEGYSQYFDLIIDKCRSGALIIIDNVLWSGKVVDMIQDKKTKIIDKFNHKVKNDDRVENFLLPIRDGLNIVRKK